MMDATNEAHYWQAVEESLSDLDSCLSRTAKGRIDTSVSNSKIVSHTDDPAIMVQKNRERVCEFLRTMSDVQLSALICKRVVLGIADAALAGFQVPPFRQWNTTYEQSKGVQPEAIESELEHFYDEMFTRLKTDTRENCVLEAAWAEYKLNVELHPFYDACSRISRYVAAWLLCRWRRLPPIFESLDQYWEAANGGVERFKITYSVGVEMREKKIGLDVTAK